jgi:hypothetical protein
MVKALNIGPYSIPVLPLYEAPLLLVEAGGETEALASLLNHAVVNRPENGLAEAIKGGWEGSDPISYVSPAGAEDDLALREAWARKTGELLEPGALALVGVMGRDDKLPVSWAALRQGLAELQSIRSAWHPDPGPWLFVRPIRSQSVTPQDYELISKLETEAATIDDLDFQAEVGEEPASLIERRRIFLRECQEAGVFASDLAESREYWLNYWSADRLLALRGAAAQLRSWGLLADDQAPLDGGVCLDYVRHQLWPPGDDGEKWAHAAVRLLEASTAGEQGVILEIVGQSATKIWWRRDGDQPTLLAIDTGR